MLLKGADNFLKHGVDQLLEQVFEINQDELQNHKDVYYTGIEFDGFLVSGLRGFEFKNKFIVEFAVTRPECRRLGYIRKQLDALKLETRNMYVLATPDTTPFWIKMGFTEGGSDIENQQFNPYSDTYLLKFQD